MTQDTPAAPLETPVEAGPLLLPIDGDLYELELLPPDAGPRRFVVRRQLAKGRRYEVVRLADGFARCECKGHLFRGTCKHVKALRQVGLLES